MTLAGKTGHMLSMEPDSDADPDHEPETLPGPARLALPARSVGGATGAEAAAEKAFFPHGREQL